MYYCKNYSNFLGNFNFTHSNCSGSFRLLHVCLTLFFHQVEVNVWSYHIHQKPKYFPNLCFAYYCKNTIQIFLSNFNFSHNYCNKTFRLLHVCSTHFFHQLEVNVQSYNSHRKSKYFPNLCFVYYCKNYSNFLSNFNFSHSNCNGSFRLWYICSTLFFPSTGSISSNLSKIKIFSQSLLCVLLQKLF